MQLKCWTLDFCHFFFRRMDYWLRSWYFNWFFSSVIYVAYGKQFFFLRCICCNWEQVYYCDVFFVSMLLFFHFGLFMHACVCTFWDSDYNHSYVAKLASLCLAWFTMIGEMDNSLLRWILLANVRWWSGVK